MSTVIGIKKGNNVWIGSDGRGTTDDGYIRPVECIKVFRNGPYLIGFIGTVRGGQILMEQFYDPPESIEEFPDDLREYLAEKGCLSIEDDHTQTQMCNFLVGFEGNLYEILSDFHLGRVDNYSAIGSGSYFAFGSLYTSERRGLRDPVKRIQLGLETAAYFDVATAAPFRIHKL